MRGQSIFGYSEGEVLGQGLDLLIPERLRAAHWAGFDAAIETGDGTQRDVGARAGGRYGLGEVGLWGCQTLAREVVVDLSAMSFTIDRDPR